MPQNIEEVRDLVEAVQLLCDEAEFEAATILYRTRLNEGGFGFDAFKTTPALVEGLECALAFVSDSSRKQKVENILGMTHVASYYSFVSVYHYLLGNLIQAQEWRYKTLEIRRLLRDKDEQSMELNNISHNEMVLGNIGQARKTLFLALSLSHETRNLDNLTSEFAYKAYYEFLLGHSSQAYKYFEIALLYEKKKVLSDVQHLYSTWGNQEAEFFIRVNAWKQFETSNALNIQLCEENHWNEDLAVCQLLQGWKEIYKRQVPQAENMLTQAECFLRPSNMVERICRLDWAWVLLAEVKEEYEKGLHQVNEALFTAADKGFRLWQADLMVLRGRLYLQKFNREGKIYKELLERGGDDGHETLKIAEQTGYIWPKVEALELLAAYHQTRATLPGFNAQDEKDKAQSYANEAASIKKGLFLTEEQMQELKAQARKEFEKQIAGWEKEL